MSRFSFPRIPAAAFLAAMTTAPASAELLISQIYEGATGTNKFIELHNTGATEVDLSQYFLALFSNENRENWKTGTPPSGTQQYQLPAEMLAPDGYFLIKNSISTVPAYAVTSANASANSVANFNGDDSVVLYLGNTWATDSIRDAFSISAEAQAQDASWYRASNDAGFNLDAGTSSVVDFNQVWVPTTVAEVASAAPTDPWYLSFKPATVPPSLDSFSLAGGQESTVSPLVVLTIAASGGPPTEFRVSESASFDGAPWQAYSPSPPPRVELSAGLGPKTVHLQLRNAHGESAAASDTITRLAYTYAPTVLITQYYEGTGNNKYLELSNLTAAPVVLDTWVLARWSNAAAEGWKSSGPGAAAIPLTGLALEAYGTLVVAHNLAGSPAIDPPPALLTVELSFNGDDSISLHNDTTIDPATLVDVVSVVSTGDPTGAGAGKDISYVRISTAQGFDFAIGSTIADVPTVWLPVPTADVDASTSDQNIHLGTYPGGLVIGGYDAWAATHVGIGPRTSDDEGDGLTNIMEYATGGNPSVPDTPYSVDLNPSGKPRLVVQKGAIAAADPKLTYAGEASTTLADGSWSSTGTTTIDSPTQFVIEFTGTATTAFLRLRVDLQP